MAHPLRIEGQSDSDPPDHLLTREKSHRKIRLLETDFLGSGFHPDSLFCSHPRNQKRNQKEEGRCLFVGRRIASSLTLEAH
jgi:hypothetical protein